MKTRAKYRQLWEKTYGPIPVDEAGRPYDIHHIDGDSSNNDLSNLKCVSLQEHYNIHWAQGDYWACRAIAIRLNISEEERVQILKLSALKRKGLPRPDMLGDKNPMRNPEYAKKLSDATKSIPKSDKARSAIAKAQQDRLSVKFNCQFCNRGFNELNFKRFHGDRCLKNPALTPEEILIIKQSRKSHFTTSNPSRIKYKCNYCGKSVGTGNYKRWHGENCKEKQQ